MEIYFLTVLEIGKSKIKVLTNSFPEESSPSWTADGLSLVSAQREGKSKIALPLLMRPLIPPGGSHSHALI